jgi:hypothetical protein
MCTVDSGEASFVQQIAENERANLPHSFSEAIMDSHFHIQSRSIHTNPDERVINSWTLIHPHCVAQSRQTASEVDETVIDQNSSEEPVGDFCEFDEGYTTAGGSCGST